MIEWMTLKQLPLLRQAEYCVRKDYCHGKDEPALLIKYQTHWTHPMVYMQACPVRSALSKQLPLALQQAVIMQVALSKGNSTSQPQRLILFHRAMRSGSQVSSSQLLSWRDTSMALTADMSWCGTMTTGIIW